MEQMTLAEIIQDIHAMDEELWHYESRYGLRTQYFLELYTAGQLHDEDPLATRDYTDWAACYEIKRHREELYESVVRDMLRKAKKQAGISLADLKLTLRPVPIPTGA
jgi:hypothetical protein